MKIKVLDLEISNIRSLVSALSTIGYQPEVIKVDDNFKNFNLLFLPGVGSFDSGIKKLINTNAYDAINSKEREFNIFGICLGAQLLLEKSEESIENLNGLSIIEGNAIRISSFNEGITTLNSWKRIDFKEDLTEIFYLNHSYAINVYEKNLIARYKLKNKSITAAIGNEIGDIGVQFHPEKSGQKGLNWLSKQLKKFAE